MRDSWEERESLLEEIGVEKDSVEYTIDTRNRFQLLSSDSVS